MHDQVRFHSFLYVLWNSCTKKLRELDIFHTSKASKWLQTSIGQEAHVRFHSLFYYYCYFVTQATRRQPGDRAGR